MAKGEGRSAGAPPARARSPVGLVLVLVIVCAAGAAIGTALAAFPLAERPFWIGGAAAAGLLLGIALAWWTHPLRARVRPGTEFAGAGTVLMTPFADPADLRALPPDRRTPPALVLERPASAYAVAVRDVLAAIDRGVSRGEGGPIILVAAPQVGVGATTLAVSLAIASAAAGRRTLLIDADLRAAGATRLFEVDAESGIYEAAIGAAPIAHAVAPILAYGFDLAPATTAARGRELYSTVMWADAMAAARRAYDLVLIDAPPALATVETRMLARSADGLVIAARRGRTPALAAAAATRAFERSNAAPIVATVVTDAQPPKGKARAGARRSA